MANKNLYPSPHELKDPSVFFRMGETQPKVYTWDQIIELIRNDLTVESITHELRRYLADGDEKRYKDKKPQLGGFTPASQCWGGHKAADVQVLTGVSLVDLDHIPDGDFDRLRKMVVSDPFTFLCYTTPSGHGLRILFRYTCPDPEVAYVDAWLMGNCYYKNLTGIDYDPHPKDAARISFFAHDPDVVINRDCQVFSVVSAQRLNLEHQKECATYNLDDVQGCCSLAKKIADKHITWVEGHRHRNLMYRAFLLNKMGVDQASTAAALAEEAPRGADEARDIAEWVYQRGSSEHGTWNRDLSHRIKAVATQQQKIREKNSKYVQMLAQVKDYLKEHNLLRYNTVTAQIEVFSQSANTYRPIEDRNFNSIWLQTLEALDTKVPYQEFCHIIESEFVPSFNPIESYLDSLPAWDGHDHILDLALHVHEKDPDPKILLFPKWIEQEERFAYHNPTLFAVYFRKWLCGMVKAWTDPDSVNQTILTIIGPQGVFKTTFFRQLLPPELQPYFMQKGSSHLNKDDRMALASRALIDLDEIDAIPDRELGPLKQLLTNGRTDDRPAYGRFREQRYCIASFCATGNHKVFLTDPTGNRRFLPIEVTTLDAPDTYTIPYPQLYAQVKDLLSRGFKPYFDRDDDLWLDENKQDFTQECLEESLIRKYYRVPHGTDKVQFLSLAEIIRTCSYGMQGSVSKNGFSAALNRLGFKRKRTSDARGFLVHFIDADEEQRRQREALSEVKEQAATPTRRQMTIDDIIPPEESPST